jgi:hypothetical protein
MGKRVWLGMSMLLLAVAPMSGCRAQGKVAGMDTTKDVYRDDEAPKVQVYVENGVAEEVPWEKVPEASRWMFAKNEDGTYKFRVPIVREEITSLDKQGRPVPAKEGWEVNGVTYGLNPKYVKHTYYGHAH